MKFFSTICNSEIFWLNSNVASNSNFGSVQLMSWYLFENDFFFVSNLGGWKYQSKN